MKIRIIFQVVFNPIILFQNHSNIFERDLVYKVVNYGIKWLDFVGRFSQYL